MIQKQHLHVSAGLIWHHDGKILISKRPETSAHAGKWELPGGKLEPGETPEQALVREISEELCVAVEAGPRFKTVTHDYGNVIVTLYGIHARFLSGEPKRLGVADFRWIDRADVRRYSYPEANEKLFASNWSEPPAGWTTLTNENRG